MTKRKLNSARVPSRSSADVVTGPDFPSEEVKWWREAIEGLLIAIVLALMIRGFEAEAFVIPTGSMAPGLQGGHKELICKMCQYRFRTGSSLDQESISGAVIQSTCPMCMYPQELPLKKTPDFSKPRASTKDYVYDSRGDKSVGGDRILVNKFAYDTFGTPERFDVIVFKNPANAKQNYIKRLCGLPGETLRLVHGDIFVKPDGAPEFSIARKPSQKLRTLLQLVHDTRHISEVLEQLDLPPRWQADSRSTNWTTTDKGHTFALGSASEPSWIRYRHIVPQPEEWEQVNKHNTAPTWQSRRGQLIGDFYAYNAHLGHREQERIEQSSLNDRHYEFDYMSRSTGKNWVGDLAIEADLEVTSLTGTLLLHLVEAGWTFQVAIDVATGEATLTIDDGQRNFSDGKAKVTTTTPIRGKGKHRLLFSNVDDELRLQVDGTWQEFDALATYGRDESQPLRPVYRGPNDPGDLAPLAVGGKEIGLSVNRLRVYRDVYYVAVKRGSTADNPLFPDCYDIPWQEMGASDEFSAIQEIFSSPEMWESTPFFNLWRSAEFTLRDFDDDRIDEFFPMGDNSPQSQDARIWPVDSYVQRQYLIGEAAFIYWPGGRSFLPNPRRTGIIH